RRGRALETAHAGPARLLAARLGPAARAGAGTARALGRRQMQLAGEAAGGVVVVQAGDHDVGAALGLGTAAVVALGRGAVRRRRARRRARGLGGLLLPVRRGGGSGLGALLLLGLAAG